ncbi:MAG: type II toxin-antitoxin system VapC family toxin [Acidimicrobiales bacterium]
MICFADSSAVVKLYAGEEGADAVRDLSGIAVAQIARVEVPAALWRKHRLAELTAEEAGVLTAELEADYFGTDEEPPRFVAVATTAGLLDEAARLCAAHGLRAYDAVQLASALLARALDDSCATIAAFDSSLRGAAAAEGFALLPAEV